MVATLTQASMLALATAARRGDRKAVGDAITALTYGAGYRTNAGSPSGSLTPNRIGEMVYDTTNDAFFMATDLTNNGWFSLGFKNERSSRFEVFDDFHSDVVNVTSVGQGLWIAFAGTDGDATAATIVAAPEGQMVMGSGDGGTTNDGSVLSSILLAMGALVSDGQIVFEVRVSFDQITGVAACLGLSDTLATDDEHLLHTIVAGTVADGGLTVTNTAEFVYSEEATAGTLWHAASENAGTIGNSGAEETLGVGPTIDTYQVLRLEVDADGTARFYIDGDLKLTRASAVATTAVLIPYLGIDGEAATPVVTDMTIDYIYFSGAKPSSNA